MRRISLGLCLLIAVASFIAACGDADHSIFTRADLDGGTEPPPPPFVTTDDDGGDPDDAGIDCVANPELCAVCGDGLPGLGESCDDGNTESGDGCSDQCQVEGPYWACAYGQACVDVRDCDALIAAGLSGPDGGGCVVPPKVPVCGDGVIDPGEACDDGNKKGGDGCAFDCAAIEPNYVCPAPGAACVSTMVCGDGKITGTEQCDDGNTKAGDGCSASCMIEPGWKCPTPGAKCTAAKCGDGKLAGDEQCDDGNTANNDGCSSACRIETVVTSTPTSPTSPGKTTVTHYKCPTPGAKCVATTCGDGNKEGSEQCDDGNTKAFDGCSPSCELEPSCPGGTCQKVCGDGILFAGEACDDGNTVDGDGCSSTCTEEPGYTCAAVDEAAPSFMDLPVTIRDFKFYVPGDATTNPDFESYWAAITPPDSHPGTKDLVKTTLTGGKWGVPQFNRSSDPTQIPDTKNGHPSATITQITNATSFGDWYQDTPRSKRLDGLSLRLTRDGAGSYVFNSKTDEPYKSKGPRYQYTGTTGLFLPIDGMGWGNQLAGQPADMKSNFAFTTELRYWFTYVNGSAPTLTFSGDDDVWVFVNGRRALDLGGLHAVVEGSFTLNAATANALGLANNGVYEIALFHAERRSWGSNFWLTLKGFNKKHSVCTEKCGDGIKTPSEQCDHGAANTNSGAYGSCTTQCKLGPYCGDKVVTIPPEQCDDGVNLSSWAPSASSSACAPGCVKPVYCGDGIVQGVFGEQCDDGAGNTGAYGGCKADCKPGPRCGDGKVDGAYGETCDNGANLEDYAAKLRPDSCSPTCKTPRHCGDGTVDYPFEQCDQGSANTNDGSYGSCSLDCRFGPRCGDGKVQAGEECDDGNRVSGDGCSATCKREGPK